MTSLSHQLRCAVACVALTASLPAEGYMKFLQKDGVTCLADAVSVLALDSAHAMVRADQILADAREAKEAILAIAPKDRTFVNTVRALDDAEGSFGHAAEALLFHSMLSSDVEGRTAPFAKVVAEQFAIFMDPALYQACTEYLAHGRNNEVLSDEEQNYLDDAMASFEKEGFKLAIDSPEKFEQVVALQKRIGDLSVQFDSNIDKDHTVITATVAELDGVEQSFIDSCERNDDGDVVIHCTMASRQKVAQYCHTAAVRERFWRAWNGRCYPANKIILEELFALRSKVAKLLGFKSYADYTLSDLMIKSADNAHEFVAGLRERAMPKWDAEFAALTADSPKSVVLNNGELEPWDISYLIAAHKRKQNFDDREVANYFPVETTTQAIFDIYARFMDVSFKLYKAIPEDIRGAWHESCQAIEVRTKSEDRLIGYVIMDLYPRKSKYSHACHGGLVPGMHRFDQKSQSWYQTPSVSVLVANFPMATVDKPALLSHYDATTFFHEFGHAMHQLMGRSSFQNTTGTSVKHDFVEMPSQILEEWMWDEQVLKMTEPFQVSRHYQTGKALPSDLIDKMRTLNLCDRGQFVVSQLGASELALLYHAEGESFDLDAIMKHTITPHIRYDEGNVHYASFGHLTGYGPKYYGYMFSRAYAQDVFERIKEHGAERGVNGLIDPVAGERFVSHILRPAGSMDPNVLLRMYLGRAPSFDAFCRSLGL